MINVISLGAGVQSSTMALMATAGEIDPMPDCAIFADTGDEPSEVYTWLEWLEKQLSFPVYHVSKGVLSEDLMKLRTAEKSGNIYSPTCLPVHLINEGGGQIGMQKRHCTSDYKIVPIQKKLRELVGLKRATKKTPILVSQWIGISTDEAHRMKPNRQRWIKNRWPLVDMNMERRHCLEWLEKNGFPRAPRSACVYCPYHSDQQWKRMKENDPEAFEFSVQLEKDYQKTLSQTTLMSHAVPYLHRSRVPLDQVDFDPDKDQVDMFGNECEGVCGV